MTRKGVLVLGAVCVLVGCGTDAPVLMRLSIPELQDEMRDIGTAYGADIGADNYTPLDTLPPSGGGTYLGVIGFGIGDVRSIPEAPVLGRLSLRVDLGRDAISGSASQFVVAATNEELDGALAINMTLDRTVDIQEFYSWDGTMKGDIVNTQGGVSRFDLSIMGDFYRDDRAVLFGDVSGPAVTPYDDVLIEGLWVATK